MIKVENVTYEYSGLRAVDDVSFEIPTGSITALVGPNGAGKTTLMRCMAALERPMWGRVLMDDVDIFSRPRESHARMGYLPDFFGLYEELTIEKCLRHRAAAQNIPKKQRADKIEKAAARMDLLRRMDQKSGELSRGLRQRLAIAQAIIHEPDFVLLDEPASGLDPEARYTLSTVLRHLRRDGMTLMVSSHILSELEDYSTHLAIMRDGKLLNFSSIDDKDKNKEKLKLYISLASEVENPEAFFAGFGNNFESNIDILRLEPQEMTLLIDRDISIQQALLKNMIEKGWAVTDFYAEKGRLQDSYLATMQKEARK